MILLPQDIRKFQKKIFFWWAGHRRDLPWRHTHNPYNIMVSEVMLQQTQVERVIPKYTEFVKTYPIVTDLAQAKISDVLKLWKGMGYNRRALYLKKAAEAILEAHNGVFPASEEALLKLPGIGRYTARAILVFSFKQDIAMVDTNIRKIITHFFFHSEKQPEMVIQRVADQLVPKGKSWEWHQALMDYGATNAREWRRPERSPESVEGRSRRIVQKKNVPFRESNRFFRGRMMDLVRENNWKHKSLMEEMVRKYGKNVPFYEKIIDDLLREGLLTRSSRAIVSLPE